MLLLRLAALLVVVLLLVRPAVAFVDDVVVPTKLLILLDSSQSMAINDEFNGASRWDNALRLLLRSESVQAVLKKLQNEQRLEIVYYQAAEEVAPLNAESRPTGKRTDIGLWLNWLLKQHGAEKNLRGLVVLSDGADNGTLFPTLEEARKWRGACPIYAFGLGSPNTTPKQRDIFFEADKIFTAPNPAFVKGKIKVRAFVSAPGFEGAQTTLRLFLGDQEKARKEVKLLLTRDNEVDIECDAPETTGDYKLTLKLDPNPLEISKLNNEISTYVTVTKEGLSVLWVEGKKRLESTWVINQVLKRDPRFRIYYTERLKTAAAEDEKDWYGFQKHQYDVIVIGDISGSRFAGGHPEVFAEINKLVQRKTGLLLLGGFESLGGSDWDKYPKFTEMLPVKLDAHKQIDGPVRLKPTQAGFDHYVMRLADDPELNKDRWDDSRIFGPLQGASPIGTVKELAVTLATTEDGKPLMARNTFGVGRVVVFGGDTTYKAWCRTPEAYTAYQRFWNRLIRWLAHQEKQSSDIWVKLDTRRLPAGANHRVGITVGLGGVRPDDKKKKVSFRVKVKGPGQEATEVSTFPESETGENQERGYFWKTNRAGEYEVTAHAVNEEGKEVGDPATVRFLAYPEDLENLRPGADHKLLGDIAQVSGGTFHVAGERELEEFLEELGRQGAPDARPHGTAFPDWGREPSTETLTDQLDALWSSGVLVCYVLFTTLLCVEWYVRRRWNMV
jgi:uncharacterized membrane protein